jgi:hypothetical protein
MKQLVLALYAEGRTDERFLPVIIQRTADHILRQRALTLVDVLEPLSLKADTAASSRKERILSVAKQAAGFHALIVHSDADAPTADDALQDRFELGQRLVQESENNVCRDLLPIIPITMTEAWMMADVEAFREVVGTDLRAEELGFPARPHQVEAIQDPKHELNMVLSQTFAQRRRRKKARLGQYYEPLARHIRLDRLENVPAFQRFTNDLTNVLENLHFIRSGANQAGNN